MRTLSLLVACASTLVAGAAHAERGSLGVMIDVGVPSGAGGALVVRPVDAVRLHVGAAHNLVGPGVGGGVTIAPLPGWFSPTVGVEAGRFFPRDANGVVEQVTGEPSELGALERFGYDFASAHVGLELGRRAATFYLHGGVSVVQARSGGTASLDDGATTMTSDVDTRALGASARLGLIVYLDP